MEGTPNPHRFKKKHYLRRNDIDGDSRESSESEEETPDAPSQYVKDLIKEKRVITSSKIIPSEEVIRMYKKLSSTRVRATIFFVFFLFVIFLFRLCENQIDFLLPFLLECIISSQKTCVEFGRTKIVEKKQVGGNHQQHSGQTSSSCSFFFPTTLSTREFKTPRFSLHLDFSTSHSNFHPSTPLSRKESIFLVEFPGLVFQKSDASEATGVSCGTCCYFSGIWRLQFFFLACLLSKREAEKDHMGKKRVHLHAIYFEEE
jgi:hypothetical protein